MHFLSVNLKNEEGARNHIIPKRDSNRSVIGLFNKLNNLCSI